MDIPLDQLVFGRNPPAGMDILTLLAITAAMRKTAEAVQPPVLVAPIPGTSLWRVTDGRHRVIASLIAGRTHVHCQEEQ